MQRLFSTFAGGPPGAGLLIQRLIVGTALLYCMVSTPGRIRAAPQLIGALAGLLLIAGLWTPAAGVLIAGNIRELQNVIERSVVLSSGPDLHLALPELIGGPSPLVVHGRASNPIEASERNRILQALNDTNGMVGGTKGAAARL